MLAYDTSMHAPEERDEHGVGAFWLRQFPLLHAHHVYHLGVVAR
jgi:hypothetical protein